MWPEWLQLQPRGWYRWREANWRAVTNEVNSHQWLAHNGSPGIAHKAG